MSRPGQDFNEDRFDNWLKTVNGGTLRAVAAARGLHFEAEIVLTATLRASVDQPAESPAPKPMPRAERAARMNQLKTHSTSLGSTSRPRPWLDECVFQFEHKSSSLHRTG